MRAKLFVSPKLLLPPALLAAVLAVLGTMAAANTHSVEPGDTLSRIAVNDISAAASQEILSRSRPGGAAGASSSTTVPILLAANTGKRRARRRRKKPLPKLLPTIPLAIRNGGKRRNFLEFYRAS